MADETVELTPAQVALRDATEAAVAAAAALAEAQKAVEREAVRPKDRAEAEARLAEAEQQLADKEKPAQDLAHARHDLATTQEALRKKPSGLSDEEWVEVRAMIERRVPGLEKALEAASMAYAAFDVTTAEIDLAAHKVHDARDFLAEFDAEAE